MSGTPSALELKDAYDRGENVMRLLRERESSEVNSSRTIEAAYDLQAGAYWARNNEPSARETNDRYTAAIAEVIDGLECESLLAAGVGEAITLTHVCKHLRKRPPVVQGFDISWSRLAHARMALRSNGIDASLAVGDLADSPFLDGSFDVVFTSHVIEPNGGNEERILAELHRIARRFVVTLEPDSELGNAETRNHIEKHRYCRDLPGKARSLGYKVREHRLFPVATNPSNQTGLMILEKPTAGAASNPGGSKYACPHCRGPLEAVKEHLFCKTDCLVFPVLDGIPCLQKSHGILASFFDRTIRI
jgi:ubiquinone/menaquinone biosynthesis C-methylase UbiE